jgi:hypothetical protein
MNIADGKVVPAYQPELIKAALQFMQRVQRAIASACYVTRRRTNAS